MANNEIGKKYVSTRWMGRHLRKGFDLRLCRRESDSIVMSDREALKPFIYHLRSQLERDIPRVRMVGW
ncbi:hypothetical protein CWI73_12205 [Idiomarina piscisalsi]|uniref:Uncharacterized protein n=1 Tax=Idiomarina piscisalsi TaxID=1096243 RepID=A0A432YHH8_9GAMM|nr:hypothetical protein CWI73_12205 [Idiomarina piscisalsi]